MWYILCRVVDVTITMIDAVTRKSTQAFFFCEMNDF